MNPKTIDSYFPMLDVLRGIAVSLVFGFHYASFLGSHHPSNSIAVSLSSLMMVGWVGVDIFFVLSGFLITRILLSTKGSPDWLRTFWRNRILRIFPNYYLILLVLIALAYLYPERNSDIDALHTIQFFYWTYLNNWLYLLDVPYIKLTGHMWSLAVEEQFYLIWPLFVWLLSQSARRTFVILYILLCPVVRWAGMAASHGDISQYVNTFYRADLLFMGALLADLSIHWKKFWTFWLGAPIIIAFGCVVVGIHWANGVLPIMEDPRFHIIGFTGVGLFAAGLVWAGATTNLEDNMLYFVKPLIGLGKISYAFYLLHVPAILIVNNWIGAYEEERETVMQYGVGFLLSFLLTLVGSILIRVFVEKPILSFRMKRHSKHTV